MARFLVEEVTYDNVTYLGEEGGMSDYDRIERRRSKFFEGEIDKSSDDITGADVGLFFDLYFDAELDQFELYIVEDGVRKFIKDLIPSEREGLVDDGTWFE